MIESIKSQLDNTLEKIDLKIRNGWLMNTIGAGGLVNSYYITID